MRLAKKAVLFTLGTCLVFLALLPTRQTSAQDGTKLPKSIFIQAQAMGQAQQLGRTFSVNIIIEEFSTAADQKALLEAFTERGNEGLVNAVSKMKSKGRIAITGTLGYDLNYIRRFVLPDGSTKLRMLTDRPITFGEAWSSTRSMDYNLSGVEIIVSADKKKKTGTLLPAAQLKLDKQNHLEIEVFQNPWNLVNIRQR